MTVLLEVENKTPLQVEKFSKIEQTLRTLRSYGRNSFASLTKADGSYVQVAGGRVTCILEHRNHVSGKHFRAYLESPHVPFTGTQTLVFGGGHMNMEPDEILFIDDVLLVFKAFFDGKIFPEDIFWRDMSDTFSNHIS